MNDDLELARLTPRSGTAQATINLDELYEWMEEVRVVLCNLLGPEEAQQHSQRLEMMTERVVGRSGKGVWPIHRPQRTDRP